MSTNKSNELLVINVEKSEADNMLDLINHSNRVAGIDKEYRTGDLTLGVPTVIPNQTYDSIEHIDEPPIKRDTSITVSAAPDSHYNGSGVFHYRRVDLSLLWQIHGGNRETISIAQDRFEDAKKGNIFDVIKKWLPVIPTSIVISPLDFENQKVKELTITAKENSYLYTGSLNIDIHATYPRGPIEKINAVTNWNLSFDYYLQ